MAMEIQDKEIQEQQELDNLLAAYKAAVEEWIAAIRRKKITPHRTTP